MYIMRHAVDILKYINN